MNYLKTGFHLHLVVWLALVLLPSGWALWETGAYEELFACLKSLLLNSPMPVAMAGAAQ